MAGFWSDVQLGTVGEWFSGLGGLLAVGAVVWFGRSEHRRAQAAQAIARSERERARRAEQRMLHTERREKASRIWIEGSGHRSRADGLPTRFLAEVHNVGDSVFRDVDAIATWNDGVECASRLGMVPNGTVPFEAEVARDCPADIGTPRWRIEYTDVYGLRWSHSSTGELARLEHQDQQP